MNPDSPQDPRSAAESNLTALLLGELPHQEAAALHEKLAQDPELAARYERLKHTINLVRETFSSPAHETADQPAPLKLSEDRRQKLLQHFKTVAPREFAQPRRRWTATLLQLSVAAALVLLLASLLLPALAPAKSKSMRSFSMSSLSRSAGTAAETPNSTHRARDENELVERFTKAATESIARKPSTPLAQPVPAPITSAGTAIVLPKDAEPADAASASKTAEPATRYFSGAAYGGYSYLTPITGGGGGGKSDHISLGNGQLTAQGGTAPLNTDLFLAEGKKQSSPSVDFGLAWSDSSPHQKQRNIGVADNSVKNAWSDFDKDGFSDIFAERDQAHPYSLTTAGNTDPKPQLNFDTRTLPGLSGADASQVPVQGDAPVAGRAFYRLKGDEVSADVKVEPEEKVKSVELADKLAQEDLTVQSNPPALAKNLVTLGVAEIPRRPAPPVVLPAAQAEATPPVNSSSTDQESRGRVLAEQPGKREKQVASAGQLRETLKEPAKSAPPRESDASLAKPAAPAAIPQPEVQTSANAFSTFSLNVSDVSFKLAAASLEKGVMPEPATVRSEEFINAFDYRDPEPPPGVPVAFAWERAQYPFAQNRDLLRFSIKTAAQGRQPGRPMNIVLLLDNSGSMERADRVQIIRDALRLLAAQLQPQDKFSVVTFARTARLWVDGVPGNQAAEVVEEISGITPQGGTNLEDAMNLAYQTAQRHYLANGINRVVLLTDGAANLGDVAPETLKQKVEANRKQGIALDCFGIGWEGYNDDLLEVLSRNGDGRYGFINTPEEAATGFAAQLAGALQVAASDVKVQVEFNPARVTAYRQIGYAKHQLTKEQFRDNTVAAAQIGAAESGNALYVVEVNPAGQGPLATVRVRYRVPGTSDVHEHEWPVPYTGNAVALDQSTPAMRLAATASAFSEWLVSSPYATEVTPDRLLGYLNGVPEVYGADARPKKLEWMLRQAKSISGK